MTPVASGGDSLTRFVFEHETMRGALVRLSESTSAILAWHAYPPALARVLGELLAASALLASTLKFTGSLIVQLQGSGPVRLLVVECSASLDLRATAQWDAARVATLPQEATIAELAGGPAAATLSITLDPKGAGNYYQGIVGLEGGSVAEVIEHYLATSEQLASRLVLSAAGDAAAGILMQRLPGATEDDDRAWQDACDILAGVPPTTLLAGSSTEALLTSIFPEYDLRVFAALPARSRCSCSRERVENALALAGRVEIEAILQERSDVEVTCEFCNQRYSFTPVEARAIVAAAPNPPLPQ